MNGSTNVTVVVQEWLGHRLSDSFETGKVDAGRNVGKLFEYISESFSITNITISKDQTTRLARCQLFDALQGLIRAIVEIVDDHCLVLASFQQFQARVTSNVAYVQTRRDTT